MVVDSQARHNNHLLETDGHTQENIINLSGCQHSISSKITTTNLSRARNIASSLRCCRSRKTFFRTSMQMIGSTISTGVQKIAEKGVRPSKRQPAGVEITGNPDGSSLSWFWNKNHQTHFPPEQLSSQWGAPWLQLQLYLGQSSNRVLCHFYYKLPTSWRMLVVKFLYETAGLPLSCSIADTNKGLIHNSCA